MGEGEKEVHHRECSRMSERIRMGKITTKQCRGKKLLVIVEKRQKENDTHGLV